MVKISITLPNSAQITVESDEPEVIREIIGIALRDLSRDLMQSPEPTNGSRPLEALNGSGQPDSELAGLELSPTSVVEVSGEPPDSLPSAAASVDPPQVSSRDTSDEAKGPTQAEEDFTHFCQTSNPLGDMRRVVVAAEGASRFLGSESVDTENLGQLFDLAGWHRPHSFVQTLRNAARSKFRWLERVPGKAGHYTVTAQGRKTALGG